MSSAAIPAVPEVSHRVRELLSQMTLEEKLAQLVGYWLDQGGNVVAPMQGEMSGGNERSGELAEVTRNGIGHYTRV
jgi:beta-glucosidase